MTQESSGQRVVVTPSVKEFTSNLALLLSESESAEIFRTGTPEEKLERVMLAADRLLEPQGNWGLVNTGLTLRELLNLDG